MEQIILQTKQALDIYINPQRQNIIRCMRIAAEPMTPKQISDHIGISASSVQHHIGKLLTIGVVELSHTENIHGITAKYYHLVPKTVSIGIAIPDGNQEQRLALMQNTLAKTFSGYADYCINDLPKTQPSQQFGDILQGILHLKPEQAKKLYAIILDFIESHEQKTEQSIAWEYTLIAYPVSMESHD